MGFFDKLKERKAFWKAVEAVNPYEKQFGEWTLFDRKPSPFDVAAVMNGLTKRLLGRVEGLGIVKDIQVIVRDRKSDMNAIDPLMKKEVGKVGWSVGVKITVAMLDDAANVRIDGKLQEGVEPPQTEV